MEAFDREAVESIISSWSREALLEELVQRGEDYVPEAREILHQELLRRGVTETEIVRAAEAYAAHLSERKFTRDRLVTIKTFDNMAIAVAARDELEAAGIDCLVHGSDSLLFGPGLLQVGPDPITLKVAEHDEASARATLRDFALPTVDESALDDED